VKRVEHHCVRAARELRPLIRAAQRDIDDLRQLPPGVIDAMRAAGMFRLQAPKEADGFEVDFNTFMEVVEELAQADGSAAWTVAIGNSGTLWGQLSADGAAEVFAESPDVITAGSFNPRWGRAVPVPGGYNVSGKWTFVSGVSHAKWINLGAIVTDGDDYRRDALGRVEVRRCVVAQADATILDTWHVSGLRGSGSHDIEVRDAFVPEERTVLNDCGAARKGTLWEFPLTCALGLGFVSVGLGLARSAIDSVTELAGAKKPVGMTGLLRERTAVQADIMKAEIKLRAARTLVHSLVREVWEDVEAGRSIEIEQRAMLRAAVVNAATVAAGVTDMMYTTAGGTAIYESFPLERTWRDVHAVTQQIMLSPQYWEITGRVLLGLDPGLLPL
jgi:alkylation response protein AidB-like acyl-CoA dehydrogenase